jgi:hypothetical protein
MCSKVGILETTYELLMIVIFIGEYYPQSDGDTLGLFST